VIEISNSLVTLAWRWSMHLGTDISDVVNVW